MRQRYPEPTVGALIFNDEGKIFLVKSHKWNGKYVIPGGHIELGETIEKALKREVKEETGLKVSDIKFVHLQEFIFDKSFWKKRRFIFLDYACKATSRKVRLNSEGQGYVWVLLKDALRLPVEPYTRKTIETYLRIYVKSLS